jgi:hypothetical protein
VTLHRSRSGEVLLHWMAGPARAHQFLLMSSR